ncbi:MAG: hypothetical protein ACOWYE_03965, partial [Desulfatiglandales bacterium]
GANPRRFGGKLSSESALSKGKDNFLTVGYSVVSPVVRSMSWNYRSDRAISKGPAWGYFQGKKERCPNRP